MTDRPPTVLIANRTDDPDRRHIPGSVSGFALCEECNEAVTLAPSSVLALENDPHITILCVECGLARLPPEGMDVTLVHGQAEELAAQGVDALGERATWHLRKP